MQPSTAFLLGFAGSLHCAAMCGPLLIALSKAQPRSLRESTARVVYHLGRMTSYCVLGVVLGFLGHLAAPAGFQRWLSITLGVALLLGLLAATRIPLATPVLKWVVLIKNSMRTALRRDSLGARATMGALNGLLPCGLVYVAAVGATATGHPVSGALYMAFFGLGTLPMMLSIHFAGQRLPLPSCLPIGRITRTAVLFMSLLLILRGLELGIPFVSPQLTDTAGTDVHCH